MFKDFKPVIYIVGPTASGKTGLSIQLAKHFGGEVVCADSMQIYKGMSIATAAPTADEKQGVPHHMFEFLNRGEKFSVSQYVDAAKEQINGIFQNNAVPFVVGGTGLYVDSLAENNNFGDEAVSEELRQELNQFAVKNGPDALYERLLDIDPVAAHKINPNDIKRVIRAIEVFTLSGERISDRAKRSKQGGKIYNNLYIGTFYKDRQKLYDRINKRVDIMLENGLLKEAEQAYKSMGATAAQAIGHKELFAYFEGEKTLEEAIEHLKQQTRRYAKRQITWFSKNSDINLIYMDECENPTALAINIIEEFFKKGGE